MKGYLVSSSVGVGLSIELLMVGLTEGADSECSVGKKVLIIFSDASLVALLLEINVSVDTAVVG